MTTGRKTIRAPATHPLGRLEGETQRQLAAFLFWCSLPRTQRRLELAVDAGHGDAGQMAAWRSEYRWDARAAEYDKLVDRVAVDSRSEAVRRDAQLWDEKFMAWRMEQYELGMALCERAKLMLKFPLVEQSTTADGRMVIVKPVRFTVSDAAVVAREGTRLVNLSLNLPTERVGGNVEVGGGVEHEHRHEHWADPELMAMLERAYGGARKLATAVVDVQATEATR